MRFGDFRLQQRKASALPAKNHRYIFARAWAEWRAASNAVRRERTVLAACDQASVTILVLKLAQKDRVRINGWVFEYALMSHSEYSIILSRSLRSKSMGSNLSP
jgi:hypothetical protein